MKNLLCSSVALVSMIASPVMAEPVAEYYDVGPTNLLIIPDAEQTVGAQLLPDLDKYPEYLPMFEHGGIPGVVRTYFLKHDQHNILVDTGFGIDGKRKGNTLELLDKEGIKPEDISDVLLTHSHFDHVGGLLTEGEATFPNARIWISAPELEAWQAGVTGGENGAKFARQVMDEYGDKLTTFNFGDEIIPGILGVDASGHTPGHTAYTLGQDENKIVIAGDIMHVAPVQLPVPSLNSIYENDPEKAAQTRQRILEQVSSEGSNLFGMHMLMQGKVLKRDDGGFMMRQPR